MRDLRPLTGGMALTADLVARALRPVPAGQPDPDFRRMDAAEARAVARALLAQGPGGPLRVFAYGSLIWKPETAVARVERATAPGWHRAFRLVMRGWRATPEAPGLMMVLTRGGRCDGAILHPADPDAEAVLARLVQRELPFGRYLDSARWLRVATAAGPQVALTFWAGPRGPEVAPVLPPAETARQIARACGEAGSNADYLYQTVRGLEALGIRDRNLWRLQALVAAELAALPGG